LLVALYYIQSYLVEQKLSPGRDGQLRDDGKVQARRLLS